MSANANDKRGLKSPQVPSAANATFMFYLPERETTFVLWYNGEPADRWLGAVRVVDALAGQSHP